MFDQLGAVSRMHLGQRSMFPVLMLCGFQQLCNTRHERRIWTHKGSPPLPVEHLLTWFVKNCERVEGGGHLATALIKKFSDTAIASVTSRRLPAEGEASKVGIDSNLEQTRTIVASLQTAVDFVKLVSESLAVVTQLLASSTMTDVQESITLLIYCHKFQVQSQSTADLSVTHV